MEKPILTFTHVHEHVFKAHYKGVCIDTVEINADQCYTQAHVTAATLLNLGEEFIVEMPSTVSHYYNNEKIMSMANSIKSYL